MASTIRNILIFLGAAGIGLLCISLEMNVFVAGGLLPEFGTLDEKRLFAYALLRGAVVTWMFSIIPAFVSLALRRGFWKYALLGAPLYAPLLFCAVFLTAAWQEVPGTAGETG